MLWDNRCTLHKTLGDFDPGQSRYMERTTVLGTASGYVVEDSDQWTTLLKQSGAKLGNP